ncbi:signal peptide peptidase SppA [Haloarchaeobius sp. TZWWS8]|uniref:signal peptide peptidase SppA n=1 Tax=Haloarchaeobius sp. TZWWS8 TaxID=3446121 RepID=UPI003EC127F0
MEARTRLARGALTAAGCAVGIAGGWLLFDEIAAGAFGTLEVLLTLASGLLAARLAARAARLTVVDYNVASVAVDGPISRDGGAGVLPGSPLGAHADEVVDLVDQADEDPSVDALLVELNTPGGDVVPSDDIRLAVERFDGPVLAYATDVCASGGYAIAVGCDEIWVRDGTIVGSIGVRLTQVNAKELADRLGVSDQTLVAGEYKDAGAALKEFTEPEREYLQGLVDDYYDEFVEQVAERRELGSDEVRATEARVYLGRDARERGLVDEVGTRDDVEDRLEALLDEPVTVEPFHPEYSLSERLRGGAVRVAYAFGSGLGSAVLDDETRLRL